MIYMLYAVLSITSISLLLKYIQANVSSCTKEANYNYEHFEGKILHPVVLKGILPSMFCPLSWGDFWG